MNMITCRAQITAKCLDGKPTAAQFFGDDLPMTEDGTFLAAGPPGTMDSIICDPCYVKLMPLTPSGRGLHHELTAAIDFARKHGG